MDLGAKLTAKERGARRSEGYEKGTQAERKHLWRAIPGQKALLPGSHQGYGLPNVSVSDDWPPLHSTLPAVSVDQTVTAHGQANRVVSFR